MDNKELANLIFPEIKDYTFYEEKYPARDLPEGAEVLRVAPSPTGFLHTGSLFTSLTVFSIPTLPLLVSNNSFGIVI